VRRLFSLSLLVAPALVACSFLIDFNDLQGGKKVVPDAGTEAGTEAGAGGATGCDAASCDDQDPCTLDSCDRAASDGCKHELTPGLGLEKSWAPIVADTQYRVTLTAGSDAFYFASFFVNGKQADVNLFRLGVADDDYESLRKLSAFPAITGVPVSVAGLAVDTGGVLGETLHALVAVKGSAADAQVWEITANTARQFGVPAQVGDTYGQASSFNYPVARALNGSVHGAWINADGTITVLYPAPLHTKKTFGSATTPASTLTLIGTDDNLPAVLFSGPKNGVYVETAGKNRSAMPECQTAAGSYLSMTAAAVPGHNGVWLSSWTKFGDSFLTTETHAVLCTQGACLPDTVSACKPADSANDQRDSALESVHLAGDAAEVSYTVGLSPALSVDPGGATTTASLTAILAKVTKPLDKSGTFEVVGLPTSVASQPAAAPDYRGPDFAAVAIIPGQPAKVAVAWIQPGPGSSTFNEMHLQRYRMCLPAP